MLIAVLFGGISSEREISFKSGRVFFEACKRLGHRVELFDMNEVMLSDQDYLVNRGFDMAANLVHGCWGEDGVVSGWLDAQSIPYFGTGSDVSFVCMDKYQTKRIWQKAGLLVPGGLVLEKFDSFDCDHLDFPVILKPLSEGSSIGLELFEDGRSLRSFLDTSVFDSVLIEKYIEGIEISVAVLEDQVLPPVQIELASKIYDYKHKYIQPSSFICPAPFSKEEINQVKAISMKAFLSLGCRHWGRIDYRYDGDNFYLLEINTVPGMTKGSIFPTAAQAFGMSYDDLTQKLIELAVQKN